MVKGYATACPSCRLPFFNGIKCTRCNYSIIAPPLMIPEARETFLAVQRMKTILAPPVAIGAGG